MSRAAELLMRLLTGSRWANAMRDCGKPARIALPHDIAQRTALIEAHLNGAPATLTFHARDCDPWRERVSAVVLSTYCPAADGSCRWLAADLDGADHGGGGLADPAGAARYLAAAADCFGVLPALTVARSRRGRGRHCWFVLAAAWSLADASAALALIVGRAYALVNAGVAENGTAHPFRNASGAVAQPGEPGAVELIPHSDGRPEFGWPLTLPGAGAFAAAGGGMIVDPFDDRLCELAAVPSAPAQRWCDLLAEAKRRIPPARPRGAAHPPRRNPSALERLTESTRAFLAGGVAEGGRNRAAFSAACNLLGVGVAESEARELVLAGAARCGLSEREARTAFASAAGILRRKGGR